MKQTLTYLVIFLMFGSLYAQEEPDLMGLDSTVDAPEQALYTDQSVAYPDWRLKRFKISAGLFFPWNDTEVRVGSTNFDDFGTTINLEDDLGFEKTTFSFFANAEWRISRRSRLALDFFYLNRKSTYTLEEEIEFGDNVYPVDANLEAYFNMNIYRLYYSYTIFAKPKYEIGALIGAHVLFTDVGIKADSGNVEAELNDSFDFIAPVPDIGVWFDILLSQRFSLYTNINYLGLTIDNIKGRIFSSNATLAYQLYKGLSLKAGFTSLDIKVETTRKHLDGYFKWGYNGPTFTVNYAF
ncbi:hypothetical protein [Mangrovimonas sp. TPBH4]|uniref:hypothetical protein n=1 Tax=Mangrovimonas sp. TPBH4 TaxID=1645914 RepID=UPI0006B63353|nr:hypothetical protein [Mangrovimonas sp. TPBH4]